MQIGIVGAGAIGSMLAHRFARAGHDVTVFARGSRLDALTSAGGILRARSRRGGAIDEIRITARAFDPTMTSELLIVAIRRQHAGDILDAVSRSNARRIMFAFNTAGPLARFRDAVGAERFSWCFPAAIAALENEVVSYSIVSAWLRPLQITTLGGIAGTRVSGVADLRSMFVEAGFPCVVHPDMESWLRSHAAMMAPLIACGLLARRSGALSFRDAVLASTAMREGFELVRRNSSQIAPRNMAALAAIPARAIASMLWLAFRVPGVRGSLATGGALAEAAALLDDLRELGDSRALTALHDVVAAIDPTDISPHHDLEAAVRATARRSRGAIAGLLRAPRQTAARSRTSPPAARQRRRHRGCSMRG
jgi:2-dehydropantoate 2-reductase